MVVVRASSPSWITALGDSAPNSGLIPAMQVWTTDVTLNSTQFLPAENS